MHTIKSETDLLAAIENLESKWADDGKMLRAHFDLVVNSLRPVNLLNGTLREAIASRDLKNNIINTTAGLTAGYLTKVLVAGLMKTPLTRLLGTVLMLGVTNAVTGNPGVVKSVGRGLKKMIRGKKENHPECVKPKFT